MGCVQFVQTTHCTKRGGVLHLALGATLNPKRCDIQTAAWTPYSITLFLIFDHQNFVQDTRLNPAQKSWRDATLNPKRCDIQTAEWTPYNITLFFDI